MSIFDPYFCTGTMKKNLRQLRFHTVHNKCEDVYSVIHEDRVPCHDVLVAGPPYSEMHILHLLRFCSAHEKPYFVHMPDHVCLKESFLPLLNVFEAKTATNSNRKDSGALSVAQQKTAASIAREQELGTAKAKKYRKAAKQGAHALAEESERCSDVD